MRATKFAYSSARLRTLESKLLGNMDVERMLGANDAKEAYKILNDLDYANHIGDIEKIEDFQEVIDAGLVDTQNLLIRISPDPRVTDILFLSYDFHNLKTLLKAKLAGKSGEEARKQTVQLGRVELERLEKFLETGSSNELKLPESYAKKFQEAVIEGKNAYDKNGEDPRFLDLTIDRILFELLIMIAESTKHPFLKNFVMRWIDLNNLKATLRIKFLKQEEAFLEKNRILDVVIPGGTIKIDRFERILKADMNHVTEQLLGTDYRDIVQKGIEAFEKTGSFAIL
ncbi:MAG: V-type ATPase subunit, partial [Candidatus Peregrinibacteria bacterium]|nr:V-type ATPase subunit [Candidatus Peregrinibacteria bacterium]